MILFVFAIIVALVGVLVAVGFAGFGETSGEKAGGGIVGVLVALLGVVLIFVSGAKEVPTNSLGVVTSFGHVETTVGPGLHEMAPWSHVSVLDGTIQTDAPSTPGTSCHGITIRIADAQSACAPVSIQYTIRKSGGSTLFRQYNNGGNLMSNIQNQLVTRRLDVDLNTDFENYSPINSITLENQGILIGTPKNPSVSQISQQVVTDLKKDLNGEIDIKDVLLGHIQYDNTVEAQLQSVLKQTVQTQVAKQTILTDQALAKAANALNAALHNDPLYLNNRCLDILQNAEQNNYQLPATFGNCVTSNTSSIVTPGK